MVLFFRNIILFYFVFNYHFSVLFHILVLFVDKSIDSAYFREFGVLEKCDQARLYKSRLNTLAQGVFAAMLVSLLFDRDIKNFGLGKKILLSLGSVFVCSRIWAVLNKAINLPVFQKFDTLSTHEPKEVKERVEKAFSRILRDSSPNKRSGWRYNGEDPLYHLMGLDEEWLVKKMIHQMPSNQKEFTVIDLGCGEGGFGDFIERRLLQEDKLTAGKKIHIINITGGVFEKEYDKETKSESIKVSKLTRFKIEDLGAEFQKRGFSLENNVDLIVSRWTFKHLVNPWKTWTQAFQLLRPGSGMILMDGFPFLTNQSKAEMHSNIQKSMDRLTPFWKNLENMIFEEEVAFWKLVGIGDLLKTEQLPAEIYNLNLVSFLQKTKQPFLIRNASKNTSNFLSSLELIVRKSDAIQPSFQMNYKGMLKGWSIASEYSKTVIEFEEESKETKTMNLPKGVQDPCYYGDKSLYNLLNEYGVLPKDCERKSVLAKSRKKKPN